MARKPGLGRGLDALLSSAQKGGASGEEDAKDLRHVPVEKIQRGKYQPRIHIRPEALQELADSIKAQGLVQPVVLRPVGEGYELIAGERRWRAAQLAGVRPPLNGSGVLGHVAVGGDVRTDEHVGFVPGGDGGDDHRCDTLGGQLFFQEDALVDGHIIHDQGFALEGRLGQSGADQVAHGQKFVAESVAGHQLEAAGIVGPFEGSKAREVKVANEVALEQFLKDLGQN